MDFNYSPQEEAFRREVKDFLAKNMKELTDWWGALGGAAYAGCSS